MIGNCSKLSIETLGDHSEDGNALRDLGVMSLT